MKKTILALISVLFLVSSISAGAVWGIAGTITNIMECGERLAFQLKKTDGTYEKFYVVADANNHANPNAFVYQAFQNSWTVGVGYDDSNIWDAGDGKCFSVIRIHTIGY